MRKIAAMITSIVVLFFFTTTSFAQSITLSSETNQELSVLDGVKCTSQGLQDKLEISVSNYKDYIIKRFYKPDRIVIDIPNTTVAINMKTISVKSKMVKTVRYSQFYKKIARVVVDTVGQPQYNVEEKEGKIILYIVNPIIKGVTYYKESDKASLILSGIKLTDKKNKKLFTEKYEASGKKYTITFPSSLAKIENKFVKINDGFINTIQVSNNKKTKKTSITFSTKVRYSYAVIAKSEVKGTAINIRNSELTDRGYENRGSEEEKELEKIPPSDTITEVIQPVSEEVVDLPKTQQNETSGQLLDVKCNLKDNDINEITVSLDKYANYNIMRITDHDRIVIDIPETAAPSSQQIISVDSSLVKNVRYAQFENNVARVVIDTVGQPQYQVEERTGQLAIIVENPTYKNITYNSSGDRVHFILDKTILTENESTQNKLYTESIDETGLKYTITFSGFQADIGSGTIKINDSLLSTVDIVTDESTGLTSMTFNAKDKIIYNTVTRRLSNDTAITLLKPFTKEDRLVVIDAGHGGVDPGAVSGGLKEKTLNLDIAIRLNELLKSKGIKTYMTREDDSYVGLYERTYIANNLNATLFLSIHNNAYYSSYKGTEVLYYSYGGFGQKFAQILQDVLVGTLNTYDRKIKARPELVVLKGTAMPAALAEIAFMTNTEDREKLADEGFRQKAAEALCNGVIKGLNFME